MDFNTGLNKVLTTKLNNAYTTNRLEQPKEQDVKNIRSSSIIAALGNAYKSADNAKNEEPFDKKQLEALKKAVDDINEELLESNNRISYDIHEETNRILVKLIDIETDEIIREFPSEKNLDFVAKAMEKVGLMFDAQK